MRMKKAWHLTVAAGLLRAFAAMGCRRAYTCSRGAVVINLKIAKALRVGCSAPALPGPRAALVVWGEGPATRPAQPRRSR